MKLVLRIFNFIIMGIALAATIMLFTTPAFTFNSKIAIDVQTFAKFVPETKYTSEFNIVELIGTDTINVRIKFNLDAGGVTKNMDGKREKINNDIIAKNVDEMADILWVLICLANQTGVDLTEAFKKNLEKKTSRDKERHLNNTKLK